MRNFLNIISVSLLLSSWSASVIADYAATQAMEKSYQGVRYLSGGIGDEERNEVLAREKDFNLKLLFAEKAGAYVADVHVVVLNAKGQVVVEELSGGPFFLTALPAGNYRVKVTAKEKTQQATLLVPGKGRRTMTFFW